MNCTNCGAPMTPVEGRNYFCCEFCTTFHFPQPLADSADRVTPLGGHADLDCPVCHLQLHEGSLERVPVQYCDKCRGVFVESESFASVISHRRSDYEGSSPTPAPLDREQLERKLDCPACRLPMEVHPYYGPGNVVIDSCCRCRMVWLDHGEIAAIERAPGAR